MTAITPAPSATTARHPWVPFVGAAAGAVLVVKADLVVATDDAAPTPAAVLYLLGLLLGAVAAVGAGLRRRAPWARAAVAVAAVALLVQWVVGLGDALEPVVGLATDSEIARAEVPIALAGVALLGLSWWGFRHDTDR